MQGLKNTLKSLGITLKEEPNPFVGESDDEEFKLYQQRYRDVLLQAEDIKNSTPEWTKDTVFNIKEKQNER